MRYQLIKGILHDQGRPVIGLGVTYWGSYHPLKIPVPAEDRRIGEMIVDLQDIAAAGFNIIRTAALGKIEKQNDQIVIDYPFTDSMLQKADELGLACLVRLQGYMMNLSQYPDAVMLNHNNEPMPLYASFIMNCVNHPGVIADNEAGTQALARHFAAFPPVVGYQIYNEPAYPQHVGVYCYHPWSINRYREWLVEHDLKSAADAAVTEPPRKRPDKGEDFREWINWRLFSMEMLNQFLCHLGDVAKAAAPRQEVFTCHIVRPFLPYNACRGEDFFVTAKGMDFLGITHYLEARGATHFTACMALDGAESSAAIQGKPVWLAEYNAHTTLTLPEWERAAYNAIGSAVKGIIYYQWRADFPYRDGPEANAYGMLDNGCHKTPKFEGALRMIALINQCSSLLARAHKVRSGVGILYSNHGFAYYDALDNPSDLNTKPDFSGFNLTSPIPPEWSDRYAFFMQKIYTAFRKEQVAVDFVRAEDLDPNPLGVRLLILPSLKSLGPEEIAAVSAFTQAGGIAWVYEDWSGWYKPLALPGLKSSGKMYDAHSLLRRYKITPLVQLQGSAAYLDVKLLESQEASGRQLIISLVNYDPDENNLAAGTVRLLVQTHQSIVEKAEFLTADRKEFMSVQRENGVSVLCLPALSTGGLIILRIIENKEKTYDR